MRIIESALLLFVNLARVSLRVKGYRFLLVSPPFLKRQLVRDFARKTWIRYQIGSWSDWLTGYQIFGQDSYNLMHLGIEDRVHEKFESAKKNGQPLILDLGGNIGLSSLYFSREYPGAKIICVEIAGVNVSLAERNLAGLQQVEVIEAGIASMRGLGYVSDPELGNDGFRLVQHKISGSKEVHLMAVRDILLEAQSESIFIAKIDIEGSEAELFSTNVGWVEKCDLIIIEPHDWLIPKEANFGNFLKSIAGQDRDFMISGENVFSISNN